MLCIPAVGLQSDLHLTDPGHLAMEQLSFFQSDHALPVNLAQSNLHLQSVEAYAASF